MKYKLIEKLKEELRTLERRIEYHVEILNGTRKQISELKKEVLRAVRDRDDLLEAIERLKRAGFK